MPDPGWWEALWPDPAKVLRDVGVTPRMDVVDLCSGDGWFTFPLFQEAACECYETVKGHYERMLTPDKKSNLLHVVKPT